MAFLKNVLDPLKITSDDDLGTCFITSGTGVVGHRVAVGLLEAGYKHIRVGIYKGDRQVGVDKDIGPKVVKEMEDAGATVITFDILNEDEYKMALAGVKSVFCTLPHVKAQASQFNSFLKACRHAGVENFVKLSYFRGASESKEGDEYEKRVPAVQFHRQCDDLLEKFHIESPMTYTILCASHLMSGPMIYQGPLLRDEKKYMTASYGMGVNYVSPNDIAKAAVNALVNRKKHKNKVYNLSGPLPISDKNVAILIGRFYGTSIEHVPVGLHEMEDELKKRGVPEYKIKDYCMMEKVKASGVDELSVSYTKDLEELTGKTPERFKDYLASKDTMTLQENPPPPPAEKEEGDASEA